MTEDIIPGPPQPEAPRKPSVDLGALEAYFQSIEEPFRETRDGQERVSKGINGTFVVLFIFSLIPVIPMVASRLMWRFSASTIISFHKIHFHLASFWFWWIAFFVATLAALLVAVKVSSVSNEEKEGVALPPHTCVSPIAMPLLTRLPNTRQIISDGTSTPPLTISTNAQLYFSRVPFIYTQLQTGREEYLCAKSRRHMRFGVDNQRGTD